MTEFIESLEKLIEKNADKLGQLEVWIATQKHIPKEISRNILIRFLKNRDFDVEETKALIDGNVKFRIKHNYLFSNRDTNFEEFWKEGNNVQFARLSKLTKEGYAIDVVRTGSQNINSFNLKEALRLFLMVHDIDAFIGPNNNGVMQLYDGSNFTYKHFFQFMSNIQSAIHFLQYRNSHQCFHQTQVHLIFCSSFVNKLLSMLKPLLNKEIKDSVYCHTSDLESLHKFIDKDCLPIEFGGTNGTFKEHMDNTQKKIRENRELLKNEIL